MNTKKKNKEQLDFEQWLLATRCYVDLSLDTDGEYDSMLTLWAWKGWKAAKEQYAVLHIDPATLTQGQQVIQLHH